MIIIRYIPVCTAVIYTLIGLSSIEIHHSVCCIRLWSQGRQRLGQRTTGQNRRLLVADVSLVVAATTTRGILIAITRLGLRYCIHVSNDYSSYISRILDLYHSCY